MTSEEILDGISDIVGEIIVRVDPIPGQTVEIKLWFFMDGDYLCACHKGQKENGIVLAVYSQSHNRWKYFLPHRTAGWNLIQHATSKIARSEALQFLNSWKRHARR